MTIQAIRDPIVVQKLETTDDKLAVEPIIPPEIVQSPNAIHSSEQNHELLPNVLQVTRGSSVNDIGDVEEQQAIVEDVSQLQSVVADGGRLTDVSNSQLTNPSGGLESPQSGLVESSPESSYDSVHSAQNMDQNMVHIAEPTGYSFPDPSNSGKLDRLADELPDFVHVPLQMAVEDETLDDWEKDWFAHAQYDATTHGKLKEPRIDFVYTCEFRSVCNR